jgi:hypothetical protein
MQSFTHCELVLPTAEQLRKNPPEPIILVHYGPWHFFFAIFLEMVISSGRSETKVVIKISLGRSEPTVVIKRFNAKFMVVTRMQYLPAA